MELYESIRLRQENIINQNKASIVIGRITRISDGAGGWLDSDPVNLSQQDFRIYNKRVRVLNINEGGWHVSRITLMIALWNADIEPDNETFLDTFLYNGIDYKVKDVKPILTQGFVVYKECTLEEVN